MPGLIPAFAISDTLQPITRVIWLELLGITPSYFRRVRANYLAVGQDT